MNTEKICEKFGVKIIANKQINKGIINSTNLVTDTNGDEYILQEINHYVFPDIDKLMENISNVSKHIHLKHEKTANSIDTLNLIPAGKLYYVLDTDNLGNPHFYRMYRYINNASTYDEANESLLYEAGIGFGNFQKLLNDFPAQKLHETIPAFHNTPMRYKNCLNAIVIAFLKNPERYKNAHEAIQYARHNSQIAHIITDALNNKQIPIRVVHNDTKLNNVVLSDKTHKPVAVIDLDTVMPGTLLYDYGDAIRYSANTTSEDEVDLNVIDLDLNKFTAFTKGYLKETSEILTKKELELMPYAPEVLAYELGLRFLTDYLEGDKYFKTDSLRPNHNLERALAQFKLSEKLRENRHKMSKIINSEYEKNIHKKV